MVVLAKVVPILCEIEALVNVIMATLGKVF